MRATLLIAASLLVIAPVSSFADEFADETAVADSVFHLPDMAVSATRLSSFPELDSSSITVIDRAEIERSGAHTVADLLRFVPGVEVRQSGQEGQQASVFMRGANSNQTLALVDGIPVNGAFSGTTDFSTLTVYDIERVELVRGPQSLLYGSDAIGGIINIVTRRGSEGTKGSIHATAGTNARYEGRGYLGVGGDKVRASLSGSWFQTDNERINSAYQAGDLALNGDWDISPSYTLGLQASLHDSKNGIPDDRFTDDPNNETTRLNKQVALTFDGRPTAGWDLGLTLSHTRGSFEFFGPEPNPPYYSGDSNSKTDDQRQFVDLQNVVKLGAAHRLLVGATYEELEADLVSESPWGEDNLESRQDSKSLFGALNLRPRDSSEVNLGGRVDDFSSFGTQETWRVGGRQNMGAGMAVKANAGTGFRAPSLADLYYPGFGNADLEPEESLGWDVGLVGKSEGGALTGSVTWFANDFENLIVFSSETNRPENIAEANTSGLEADATFRIGDGWHLQAVYTWLAEAENKTEDTDLLRRSEHAGSLTLWAALSRVFSFDVRANLVGDSPDMDFSAFPTAEVTNPGYAKWDLGLKARLGKGFEAVARVENIFDAGYEEAYGFPALGRTVRAGGTYEF